MSIHCVPDTALVPEVVEIVHLKQVFILQYYNLFYEGMSMSKCYMREEASKMCMGSDKAFPKS